MTGLMLIADAAVKAAVVLLLAMLATWILRRKSAALRHAVWGAAAISILLLPVFSSLLPAWTFQAPEMIQAAEIIRTLVGGDDISAMQIEATETSVGRDLSSALWWLWVGGWTAMTLPFLMGAARIWWIAFHAQPVIAAKWIAMAGELSRELGIARGIRLLESDGATMPVTWGLRRPRILLPKGAAEWPEELMRIVLYHELAHIHRNDWVLHILAEVNRAIYWFHPLVWVGCSRLRHESELACDDIVLNSGIEASAYAERILQLARTLGRSEANFAAALAMARSRNLERRLLTMFNASIDRKAATWKTSASAAIAALAVVLPLSTLQAPAQGTGGRLFGSVFDASGAAVPTATLIVSNRQAGTRDMTVSGANGRYEFSSLPEGEYSVQVLKPGFARFDGQVAVRPGDVLTQNVTLSLGSVSESIKVVATGVARTDGRADTVSPQRIRVGGNVQQTKLVKQVVPSYPVNAKAAGIEGSVLLDAVILKDGTLASLRVMNSVIDADLAKAAVEAVSQWVYEPTLLNGEPVEIITRIDVNFTLQH